jgi:hypothetical protein
MLNLTTVEGGFLIGIPAKNLDKKGIKKHQLFN